MTEAPDVYPDFPDDDSDDSGEPDGGGIEGGLAQGSSTQGSADDLALTGDPRVDAVLAGLEELDERPLLEHAGVFERAHEDLRAALEPDGESV